VRWNTTVSLYNRTATVAYDSTNISILSVESLSEPQAVLADASLFRAYCALLMIDFSSTLNFTADPETFAISATSFNFMFGIDFLCVSASPTDLPVYMYSASKPKKGKQDGGDLTDHAHRLRLYTSDYATYTDGGNYLLRSFVAVPYQFATASLEDGNLTQLPDTMKATSSPARSAYRAIIDPWTVYVFAFLAFPLILYCAVCLAWMAVWGPYSPNISAFPEIDITSKSSAGPGHDAGLGHDLDPHLEMADQTLEDLGRLTRSYGMGNGRSLSIVEAIRGRRVYCGSLQGKGGEEIIVLLTEEAGRLKVLTKDRKYA
jgi:hypothetical protein